MSEPLSQVKRALQAIRVLQGRVRELEQGRREPIAIVGLGCRFPGARDPESYWSLLSEGRDAVVEVPADRWDGDAYFDPDPQAPGKMYTRLGGFLDRVDGFDAPFFGISPREAAAIDPQHRLLLEVTWEALEHAALAPERLYGGSTGVFVGLSGFDQALLTTRRPERLDAYFTSGNTLNMAAGRLSHVLGLTGPSMVVDTACSSSLVAVHLACQSLRLGECELALASGVSLMIAPEPTIGACKSQMLSPSRGCRVFDAAADGYVRGEGCGVVVLKPLPRALADGDRVLAVIRGSAVNQDGPSGGLTVPNGQAQQAVIREALEQAAAEPADVSYVEAHGTGTPLGDPIELEALAAELGAGRDPERPLRVGSVKANIGHLEAAAGIAGLIKLVLSLERREIPLQPFFAQPNPRVPWDRLPLAVPRRTETWPATGGPRIAGISSFGFSGTNAHAIVEQAPATPRPESPAAGLQLLTLSARGRGALERLAAAWADELAPAGSGPRASLADIAANANAGRSHFAYRLAVLAESRREAARRLLRVAEGSDADLVRRIGSRAAPRIVFRFAPGNGEASLPSPALVAGQPALREALAGVDATLRSLSGRGLDEELEAGGSGRGAETARAALVYMLAQLWRSWGVVPVAVRAEGALAHAAAAFAGEVGIDEALRRVWQQAPASPLGEEPPAGDEQVLEIRPQGFDRRTRLESLAALYLGGAAVDWGAVHGERWRRLALPTYPFERQSYPLPADPGSDPAELSAELRPLAAAGPDRSWELDVDRRAFPFLADHRLQDTVVMPGTAYVELALAAAAQVWGAGRHELEDLRFEKALVLPRDASVRLRVAVRPDADAAALEFSAYSVGEPPSRDSLHATARVRRMAGAA